MIKVLFICKGNIGRSQMARGLFDKLSNFKSEAAGVSSGSNLKLGKYPGTENVIVCMKEEDIDVSEREIKQITPRMVEEAEIIIALTKEVPDFVSRSNKVQFWNIDNPKGYDLNNTRKTRDEIKTKVEILIESLKGKK
ncbi:low molecular weight phosphatase family protein [Candidatus Woesearchaeota archaeon]|nr:low molecular weight phosphatase family protein [Candidatus Woesearchaeota archaeon]